MIKQMGIDPEVTLGDEYYLYTKVNGLKSIAGMIGWFQELIESRFVFIDEKSTKSTNKLMIKAKNYITAHFHQEISLDLVAMHIHISPEHLSREFMKEIGENFVDFLLKLRINKAKEYIAQGKYKTYEISKLVGYNDEEYFSKVFKKTTGFTPSEYKFRIH